MFETWPSVLAQKIYFVLWDKDAYQDDRLGKVWIFLADYVRNGEFAQRYLHPGFLIMEKAWFLHHETDGEKHDLMSYWQVYEWFK